MDKKKLSLLYPALHCAVGYPGYGKTFLLNYLIYICQKHIDYLYIFSPNGIKEFQYLPIDDDYRKIFFHEKADDNILLNILKIQKQRSENGKPNRIALYFDDMTYTGKKKGQPSKFYNSVVFNDICTRYRHPLVNALIFISIQRYTYLRPDVRTLVSYYYLFPMMSFKRYKELYDEYGYGFETIKEFAEYIEENTKDFNAIMITFKDNQIRGKERFNIIKAKQLPKKWHIKFHL
ncbi:MAG: hypothetical protein WC554_01985 [Clostridia bacterium]